MLERAIEHPHRARAVPVGVVDQQEGLAAAAEGVEKRVGTMGAGKVVQREGWVDTLEAMVASEAVVQTGELEAQLVGWVEREARRVEREARTAAVGMGTTCAAQIQPAHHPWVAHYPPPRPRVRHG